ncbi:ABC transporter ATP-binding protein [Devosia submarina]|uniref:ABC transporter ATP-binding protein n=1 Tax=Devosia submarina TaxID=1173082 RepID=UPI001FEA8341|nr:ABC transporter ATP-binding protein [Devosia submarina]
MERPDHQQREIKLKLHDVHKSYNNLHALRPTSLEVRTGEFVTLLGPSGSGKTTLLSIIAGINFPDGGMVEIGGVDATYLPSRKRDIGVVFQNYALFPHLSVFENIAFPLRMRGMAATEIDIKVRRVLETVNLATVGDRLPSELSGGQQQRVAFGRCVVYEPSIILMDEPLGALDKRLRDSMQEEIKRLHRQLGTTIVYITHDQTEALTLSDRICLMNQGAIVQSGAPRAMYFAPESRFAADFFGIANIFAYRQTDTDGTVEIADLQVTGKPGRDVAANGQMMVRPQCFAFADGPDDRPSVPGRIASLEQYGLYSQYGVILPSGKAVTVQRLTDSASSSWAVGD